MSQRPDRREHRTGRRWLAARFAIVATGLLAAGGLLQGCAAGSQPGPSASGSFCGDGTCSASETIRSCPADCAQPPRCGDGVCAPGETCASCPADCAAACVAACQVVDVRPLPPSQIRDTTASAPASRDEATCGDGAVGPLRRYRFDDLRPGRYRVSAVGDFDLVVDARRSTCAGEELGCQVAYAGNAATLLLASTSAQTIVIGVAGLAGSAGAFSLDITPEPACGDAICQEETCASCPADCGACPPPPVCGDGLCKGGEETCASCPADCGACPPPPVCGDGLCKGGEETCASCPADCGACPTAVCGDGTCDPAEGCGSCPADCGSCAFDCGACAPSCGDGWCAFGEDCLSCPFDCGACASSCGDGWCAFGEDCLSCSFDCGSCAEASSTSDALPLVTRGAGAPIVSAAPR
jgi:hypothetical protein